MRPSELQKDQKSRKILCIFPGGFHIFTAGHASVYQYLKDNFPSADVYVASSNKTTERPFPFQEKRFLASQAGVPKNRFVEVVSPYKCEEITKNYDPSSTILIFALSEKDKDRFGKPFKKDGSPSYFQPYPGSPEKCEPFNKHGYYVITPTIKFTVLGQQISSASQIREMYKNGNDKTRIAIAKELYPKAPFDNLKKVKQILDSVLIAQPLSEEILDEGWFSKPMLSEKEREKIFNDLLPLYNIDEYISVLIREKIPKGQLGGTLWTGKKIGPDYPDPPYLFGISVNPLACHDKLIYKQVIAHELCHVEDILNNVFPAIIEIPEYQETGENPGYKTDDHGPTWQKIAARINTQLGQNFITKYSDSKISIFGNLKRGSSLKNIKESRSRGEGWILPNGKFIEIRSDHEEVFSDYGIKSYNDAYNKGWIRVSSGRPGVLFYEVGKPMSEVENRLTKLAKQSQSVFPQIQAYIGGGAFGGAWERYEWDGKQWNKFIPRKMTYESVNLKTDIDDAGWLLPNGKFIPNWKTGDHYHTLKQYGISDYETAYKKGWIRIAKDIRHRAYIETSLQLKDRYDLYETIAKNLAKHFDEVYLDAMNGSKHQRFIWSDGAFDVIQKDNNWFRNMDTFEHIEKLKNKKYRLLSHKGKNLGTFNSKKAAEKHEGEVEYFKHVKEEKESPTMKEMTGEELYPFLLKDKILKNELKYFAVSSLRQEPHLTLWWGGKLIGDLELQQNPYNKDIVWIQHVSIRKGYQGNGYAKMLLNAAIKKVKAIGKKIVPSSFSDEGAKKLSGTMERLRSENPDILMKPRGE